VTARDRVRLHQLHPGKLAVDWGTAAVAGWLLWRRQPVVAVVVGFAPSIAVTSAFLSGRLDRALESIRSRPIARRLAGGLSPEVNALRFAGLGLSWTGCWLHRVGMIAAGVAVVLAGWWLAGRRGPSNPPGAGVSVSGKSEA
jgi:hypothetical protein